MRGATQEDRLRAIVGVAAPHGLTLEELERFADGSVEVRIGDAIWVVREDGTATVEIDAGNGPVLFAVVDTDGGFELRACGDFTAGEWRELQTALGSIGVDAWELTPAEFEGGLLRVAAEGA